MKKFLFGLVTTVTAAFQAFGQPVMQPRDITPIFGETFVTHKCDTNINEKVGGPNRVWDFSTGLTVTGRDTAYFGDPSNAPYLSRFSNTTITATKFSFLDPEIYIDTNVSYYSNSETNWAVNGYYLNAQKYVTYTDPMDLVRFPLHYGDNFSDRYSSYVNNNYIGVPRSAGESGNVVVTVDGWGQLILPTGTYDTALRVHSYRVVSDSASIFGVPFFIKVVVHNYKWYAKGYHNYLLSVERADDTSGVFHWKTVSYTQRYPLSIHGVQLNEKDIAVYPNPASGQVTIQLPENAKALKIEILDITGRLEMQVPYAGEQKIFIPANSLSKGSHIFRIAGPNNTVTRKLTIQ